MQPPSVYTISAEDNLTQASIIPSLGALCTSLRMPTAAATSREVLYQSEQALAADFINRYAGLSLSFPICGKLQRQYKLGHYYFAGASYELPSNGFAWHLPWEILNHSHDQLQLVLRDNELTFACFPFQFIVELDFLIYSRVLMLRFTVTNRGEWPMPYYAGFNCYLQTSPLLMGNESLILNYQPMASFRDDEDTGDMMIEKEVAIHAPLALSSLQPGEILTRVGEDESLSLHYPDGGCVHLDAEGVGVADMFPFVNLETVSELSCIGIHSWMSYPNALNSVQGVRWLAPKHSEQGWLRLTNE